MRPVRLRVHTFPSEEFYGERLDVQPGHHFGIWAPTGDGKTHCAYRALDATMNRYPHLRVASLMPKSDDPATYFWAERLGLEILDTWPPRKRIFGEQPRGYVFWPKHPKGMPVKEKRKYLGGLFREVIRNQLERGNSLTFADDVYVLAALMDVNADLEELWTTGQGPRAGLWSTNQKPSGTVGGGHVSSFSYNAPTHYMFGKDTDVRNQRRLAEIGGGIDPAVIADLVADLKVYRIRKPDGRIEHISEKLYLHKGGPWICKVSP